MMTREEKVLACFAINNFGNDGCYANVENLDFYTKLYVWQCLLRAEQTPFITQEAKSQALDLAAKLRREYDEETNRT